MNNESSWGTSTGPLPKPKQSVTQAFKRWFAVPAYILNIGTDKGADKVKEVFNANARLYLAIQFARNKSNIGLMRVTIKNTDLMEMASLDERTFRRARIELVEAGLITAMPTNGRRETYEYEFPKTFEGFEEQDAEPVTDVEIIVTPIPREAMMAALTMAPQGLPVAPAVTQTASRVAPPQRKSPEERARIEARREEIRQRREQERFAGAAPITPVAKPIPRPSRSAVIN